jgi:hypothetical protein
VIEILKAHQRSSGHRDMREHCTCGTAGPLREAGWIVRHQAEVLAAAGYGKLPEAETEWGTRTKWGSRASFNEDNARDYMELCKSCGDDVTLISRRAAIEPGPWEDAK